MAEKYICAASEYCGKKETCYHGQPHDWREFSGCGNNTNCPQLVETKKANPDLAAVMADMTPECVKIP
jgi:hypothetical protein